MIFHPFTTQHVVDYRLGWCLCNRSGVLWMERIALNRRTHHMLQCKNKKTKEEKHNTSYSYSLFGVIQVPGRCGSSIWLEKVAGCLLLVRIPTPLWNHSVCQRVQGTFLTEAFLSKYVWKNKRSSSEVHSCANSISPKGPQYVLYCVRYCFSVKVSYNPVGILFIIVLYATFVFVCIYQQFSYLQAKTLSSSSMLKTSNIFFFLTYSVAFEITLHLQLSGSLSKVACTQQLLRKYRQLCCIAATLISSIAVSIAVSSQIWTAVSSRYLYDTRMGTCSDLSFLFVCFFYIWICGHHIHPFSAFFPLHETPERLHKLQNVNRACILKVVTNEWVIIFG